MKPYKCNVCDTTFTSKNALKGHTHFVHEGLKPFKCDICDSKFPTKVVLKEHIETVHGRNRK